MAKASVELPNGTQVTIEGTPEEIKKLLEFYGGGGGEKATSLPKRKKQPARKGSSTEVASNTTAGGEPDLTEIINLIRNSDDAEKIEANILDRVSQVNKVLLPLYIVHEHLNNAFGLTSGDINKITTNLGIPVHIANISNTLSGTASRYVMPDKVRRKGQPVRYKLSRRGEKYLSSVIQGTEDGDKK